MTGEWACRLFPHETAGGAANMALDEALLDLVTADPSSAALRTYGWSEPTLSLGYFQTVAEAESDPRWRGVPLVRRPTGGGAIWHDREITYALAVPHGHPLARASGDLYRAVHSAIAGALNEFHAGARRRGGDGRVVGASRRPFLCFTDRDPEDVVVDGSKVVGSAQRRRAGAVLQHGSVLLSRSPRTAELPGASDLAAVPVALETWSGLIVRRVPAALGFVGLVERWPDSVLARAGVIERSVYLDPAWTRRR